MPHITWDISLGSIIIVITILGTFFKMYGRFAIMSIRVEEMWDWFISARGANTVSRNENRESYRRTYD